MKPMYETPQVELLTIDTERGFAATGAIDNPGETDDTSNWS